MLSVCRTSVLFTYLPADPVLLTYPRAPCPYMDRWPTREHLQLAEMQRPGAALMQCDGHIIVHLQSARSLLKESAELSYGVGM